MKMRARARHTPGEMNGLERSYAQHLNALQVAGEVSSWRFEAVKLRLARKTFLSVDFWVVMPDGHVEFHEVKGGYWEDDSRAKLKIAAGMFHEFTFVGLTFDRRSGWKREVFS